MNGGADEKSGSGVNYFARLTYLHHLANEDSLAIATRLWVDDYPSRKFDSKTLEIFSSYRWNTKRGEVDFGPVIVSRRNQGKNLGSDHGLRFSGDIRLSSKLRLDGNLTALAHQLSRHYNPSHEGHSIAGTARLRYFFRPSFSVGVTGGKSKQEFQRETLDFVKRRRAFELGYEFPNGITTFTRHEISRRKNRLPHQFFGITRDDRQETVALTIGFRRLSVNGFFPSLTFQDQKQKSSIAIYQFKRNSMNLTFSRDF